MNSIRDNHFFSLKFPGAGGDYVAAVRRQSGSVESGHHRVSMSNGSSTLYCSDAPGFENVLRTKSEPESQVSVDFLKSLYYPALCFSPAADLGKRDIPYARESRTAVVLKLCR